ncbi:MAG TPA: radical SAM/SPASM domain-containing protein [Candidatus Hypogeohydataceae bacterium YC38]|nr:radical SAM protein [Candidatus Brocadiales bacterium]
MKLYLNLLKHILFNNLNIIPTPSLCTFLVTWRCELKCYMCRIPGLKDKSEMDTSQVKAIFNDLNTLDVVRITGGEPFVREDLPEIVQHIIRTSNPSTIMINTNGFQTSKIIDFAEAMGSPRFHFRISLDAVGERHDEIRCLRGAFQRAYDTLKGLVKLREGLGFCVGVNITITKRNIDQIEPLQRLCQGLGVDLQYQMARDDRYLLEPNDGDFRQSEFSFFDPLSEEELAEIVEGISRDTRSYNFKEGLVKRYFNEGLRNRLLYGKKTPNTRCVALTSHIRILPNGEVPICIHSNTRVGDLTKQSLREIWFGKGIEHYREMVRNCPGCWMPCEVAPNAIYTGSILRALFLRTV